MDVVGEALSCVIIDKLPFASPGDPITAARIEAINARGGSAFGDYQIPLAILALKQGPRPAPAPPARPRVLAVLDPRLRTMGYGGDSWLRCRPRRSLTLDDVERFFAPPASPPPSESVLRHPAWRDGAARPPRLERRRPRPGHARHLDQPAIVGLDRLQFLLREILDVDQPIARALHGRNQLVQLDLNRRPSRFWVRCTGTPSGT